MNNFNFIEFIYRIVIELFSHTQTNYKIRKCFKDNPKIINRIFTKIDFKIKVLNIFYRVFEEKIF